MRIVAFAKWADRDNLVFKVSVAKAQKKEPYKF
jgi:hypothetical protein